jgi:Lethal giant larvae(Lgl) like, C-terminal
VRASETSGSLIKIWGKGVKLDDIPSDSLYDVLKEQPPRPTISTFQWVKGQQYMTIEDFDLLSKCPFKALVLLIHLTSWWTQKTKNPSFD